MAHASQASDGVEKIPPLDRMVWESADHPHAIWCSYYPPEQSMKST